LPIKFEPLEKIEQLDTLWSWFDRFGLVKTMVIAAAGGGVFTFAVSWLQQLPRWMILSLVFVTSSLTILLLFAIAVWAYTKIEERIRKIVSEEPLAKRVKALETTIGPRHLSEDERGTLLKALSKAPGKIRISAISPDDDAEVYAKEIADLLKECEWNVWGPDFPYETRYRVADMTIGLVLLAPNDEPVVPYEGAQRLAQALAEARIPCRYYTSFELHKGSCKLIVGHRGTPSYS
jgi:hypothetical protein